MGTGMKYWAIQKALQRCKDNRVISPARGIYTVSPHPTDLKLPENDQAPPQTELSYSERKLLEQAGFNNEAEYEDELRGAGDEIRPGGR